MSDLILQGISKSYSPDAAALAPLDCEVRSGEFVVLVGPSGCGKSTLLRLIAGLEEPDSGKILLDGVDVTRIAPAQRDVAMVFQNYALYPHMTVRANLGFGLRVRKTPKLEQKRAVEEVAALLGLEDYLDRKPGQLSGGQRQRVALGRAIVRRPKLFLFDEPLSNLDAALRASTRAELRRLHQRLGATSIYVTHDQVEAMSMADRLIVLRGGRVEQMGTPLEIYRNPRNRFVATFIGSPPMKLIRAEARDGQLYVAGRAWPPCRTALAGPVELGFRAENLALGNEFTAGAIPASVVLAEAMGNEVLLTCALPDGQEAIVRAPAHENVPLGAICHLTADSRQALLFDQGTGAAIPSGLLDAFPSDAAHQIAL